jgi:hypothetical protein
MMSLKIKKQLNYARQDWKEHWESLLAPCVRAALREKRNSMVANVMRAALLRKYRRSSQPDLLFVHYYCNSTHLAINVLGITSTRHSL